MYSRVELVTKKINSFDYNDVKISVKHERERERVLLRYRFNVMFSVCLGLCLSEASQLFFLLLAAILPPQQIWLEGDCGRWHLDLVWRRRDYRSVFLKIIVNVEDNNSSYNQLYLPLLHMSIIFAYIFMLLHYYFFCQYILLTGFNCPVFILYLGGTLFGYVSVSFFFPYEQSLTVSLWK